MSVLEKENVDLPGVLIDFEREATEEFDQTDWGKTDSVVVIGTAFSGPTGKPVPLYSPKMARYIFGKSYDSTTHRAASLVAGVQDLYDRGARTIYGLRIGGKDIYKDFQFCDDNSNYRLRLSGKYPSNIVKDCALHLDLRSGLERLAFYKPADRATISEKSQGLVESADAVMVNVIELSLDYGLGRDSKLIDLITLFNGHQFNNVLKLQIVDTDGIDVTDTPEAQSLKIGSCFSGLYLVGRDASLCTPYTALNTKVIDSMSGGTAIKPYASYEGTFYRELAFNTDVSTEYPIYATNYKTLQQTLAEVSVVTVKNCDFMETTGLVDRAFQKDSVDYEEVNMSKFEIYKRLGEGFAITAMAKKRTSIDRTTGKVVEKKPRVIETPADDPNHIVGIRDGIYGALKNAGIRYRVVACANADDKIADRIPDAEEFKIAVSQDISLLGVEADDSDALMIATPKVNTDDITHPREYDFTFKEMDISDVTETALSNLYSSKVAAVISCAEKDPADADCAATFRRIAFANGDELPVNTDMLVFEDNTRQAGHLFRKLSNGYMELNASELQGELFCADNKVYVGTVVATATGNEFKFTPENADTPTATATVATYNNKEYMLISSAGEIYAAKISSAAGDPIELEPLGPLSTMMGDNADETLIYVENKPYGINHIVVTTAAMDFITLEEFASILNEDKALGRIFSFELTNSGYNQKDEYLEELKCGANLDINVQDEVIFGISSNVSGVDTSATGKVYSLSADRKISYDYGMYIPYKTNDNFARQLAQHCAYTTLGTITTHGLIGLAPLRDLSLKSIADRVKQAVAMNFSLFAKNYKGRELLDEENMPLDIGSNISISMFQYNVTDDNGYTSKMNGATGYAGMASQLPITRSSTMQPISIPQGVDFIFTNNQLAALTAKGYIVITDDYETGLAITDGTTMAQNDKFPKRLMVRRTLDRCGDDIRRAARPFIGLANTLENRNSLKTAIDSALKELKGKIIQDYKFEVVNLNTYTSDARIDIKYEILPFNEIRKVANSISVKKSEL